MNFVRWLRDVTLELERESLELPQRPVGAPPLGSRSLAQLDRGLRRCLRENDRYFRLGFGLAIAFSLGSIGVLIGMPGSGSRPGWAMGLALSALAALVFAMQKATEKRNFEIMLELAVGLDEAALRQVLRVLMKKYAPRDSGTPAFSLPLAPPTGRRPALDASPVDLTALPDLPRTELRLLMTQVLKTVPEFDAFCVDCFPAVYSQFNPTMERTIKENLLFDRLGDERKILAALAEKHGPAVAAHLGQIDGGEPENAPN